MEMGCSDWAPPWMPPLSTEEDQIPSIEDGGSSDHWSAAVMVESWELGCWLIWELQSWRMELLSF